MSLGNIIIGHSNILHLLEQTIYNKKFTHAHLFVGEDGIGKSLIANRLGKIILNCDQKLDHVDLIHWKLGKNKKSIGVDDIRILNEEINKKPYEGSNKVIIVYSADKMTIQAQNAFLKTIEEPPYGIHIFLLCESLNSILETIKSRCQIHKLKPLNQDEMLYFLKEKYGHLNEGEIKVLVAFSDGIPGKAETLVYDETFKEMRNTTIEFLKDLRKSNIEFLNYESIFIKYKDKKDEFFQCFLSFLRDSIIYKETANKNILINQDKIKDIEKICSVFSFSQLNDIIKIISESRDNLEKNLNPTLVFSTMLLKIQEV